MRRLEFFCMGNVSLLLLLIHIVNHLLITGWTHEYLFCALGYNTILSCLFYCSMCSSFGLWELFQLARVSLTLPINASSDLFLSTFFSGTARFSRIILYSSCPNPRISYFSKEFREWHQRPRSGAQVCLLLLGVSHLFLSEYPGSFIHSIHYTVCYLLVCFLIYCPSPHLYCLLHDVRHYVSPRAPDASLALQNISGRKE